MDEQLYENYLIHYGVKGMKWGRRKARPQSLTTAKANYRSTKKQYRKDFNKAKKNKYKNSEEYKERRKQKAKTAAKVGAVAVGTALAVYGGYKASQLVKNKSLQVQAKKGEEAYNRIMDRGYVRDYSVSTFADGTSRVMQQKKNSRIVYETVGSNKDITDRIVGQNNTVRRKATEAYNKNLEKGYDMNTREAAKNIANYYRKKKK